VCGALGGKAEEMAKRRVVMVVHESSRRADTPVAYYVEAQPTGGVVPVAAVDGAATTTVGPFACWEGPDVPLAAVIDEHVRPLLGEVLPQRAGACVIAYGFTPAGCTSLLEVVEGCVLSRSREASLGVTLAVFEVGSTTRALHRPDAPIVAATEIGSVRGHTAPVSVAGARECSDAVAAALRQRSSSSNSRAHVVLQFGLSDHAAVVVVLLGTPQDEAAPAPLADAAAVAKANVAVSALVALLREFARGKGCSVARINAAPLTKLLRPALRGAAQACCIVEFPNVDHPAALAASKAALKFAGDIEERCSLDATLSAAMAASLSATAKRRLVEEEEEEGDLDGDDGTAVFTPEEPLATKRHKPNDSPGLDEGNGVDDSTGDAPQPEAHRAGDAAPNGGADSELAQLVAAKDKQIAALEGQLLGMAADREEAQSRCKAAEARCDALDNQRVLLLRRAAAARDELRRTVAAWHGVLASGAAEFEAILADIRADGVKDARLQQMEALWQRIKEQGEQLAASASIHPPKPPPTGTPPATTSWSCSLM